MKVELLSILFLCAAGCQRETRVYDMNPSAAAIMGTGPTNTVWPGPTSNEITTNYSFTNVTVTNFLAKTENPQNANANLFHFYEGNAWSMSEGKRLFAQFNCVGCHGHGGGGMGPALMDQKWLYGKSPEDIFVSIAQGRTNGMPAFKDRIPEYMVWELVAYVRSMSGMAPKTAAPTRDDHMQTRLPENTIGAVQPKPEP
jgi:cytochrome c oxidase cbb3-type subunit 3